ncbi:MAG: hypothetical protein WA988_07370 [Candidatus Nanopelagicales bacterium]
MPTTTQAALGEPDSRPRTTTAPGNTTALRNGRDGEARLLPHAGRLDAAHTEVGVDCDARRGVMTLTLSDRAVVALEGTRRQLLDLADDIRSVLSDPALIVS